MLKNLMAPVCARVKLVNLASLRFITSPSEELIVTDKCVERLKSVTKEGECLRVIVEGGGCSGFEYKMSLDRVVNEDDYVIDKDGVKIVVDKMSLEYMKGATVDYQEDLMRSAFRVTSNPVADKGCSCGTSFALKMD